MERISIPPFEVVIKPEMLEGLESQKLPSFDIWQNTDLHESFGAFLETKFDRYNLDFLDDCRKLNKIESLLKTVSLVKEIYVKYFPKDGAFGKATSIESGVESNINIDILKVRELNNLLENIDNAKDDTQKSEFLTETYLLLSEIANEVFLLLKNNNIQTSEFVNSKYFQSYIVTLKSPKSTPPLSISPIKAFFRQHSTPSLKHGDQASPSLGRTSLSPNSPKKLPDEISIDSSFSLQVSESDSPSKGIMGMFHFKPTRSSIKWNRAKNLRKSSSASAAELANQVQKQIREEAAKALKSKGSSFNIGHTHTTIMHFDQSFSLAKVSNEHQQSEQSPSSSSKDLSQNHQLSTQGYLTKPHGRVNFDSPLTQRNSEFEADKYLSGEFTLSTSGLASLMAAKDEAYFRALGIVQGSREDTLSHIELLHNDLLFPEDSSSHTPPETPPTTPELENSSTTPPLPPSDDVIS